MKDDLCYIQGGMDRLILDVRPIIQKDCERNLSESLGDWQKILNEYNIKLREIELKEYSNIAEIKKAIAQLEIIISEINTHDKIVQSYERHTTILVGTLQQETASKFIVDLTLFFKHWEDLKEWSLELRLRMDNVTPKLRRNIQKDIERNLVESLDNWRKILNEYTLNIRNIDLVEYSNVDKINEAIARLEVLVSEINGRDEELQNYATHSVILIRNIEEETGSKLSVDFQFFFKEWENFKVWSIDLLLRLNRIDGNQFASGEPIKKTKDKAIVAEEFVKVSEISNVSSSPTNNLRDAEDKAIVTENFLEVSQEYCLPNTHDVENKAFKDTMGTTRLLCSNLPRNELMIKQIEDDGKRDKEEDQRIFDSVTLSKTSLLENILFLFIGWLIIKTYDA